MTLENNRIGIGPNKSSGDGIIKTYCIWDNLGLVITYDTLDQENMSSGIHNIALR